MLHLLVQFGVKPLGEYSSLLHFFWEPMLNKDIVQKYVFLKVFQIVLTLLSLHMQNVSNSVAV